MIISLFHIPTYTMILIIIIITIFILFLQGSITLLPIKGRPCSCTKLGELLGHFRETFSTLD